MRIEVLYFVRSKMFILNSIKNAYYSSTLYNSKNLRDGDHLQVRMQSYQFKLVETSI